MITAEELREKFGKLSVLAVGDICLDIDYIGGYSGYSREVEQLPIFRAEKVKYSPGGGGNLAVCFATLGVQTGVSGFWGTGEDINSAILNRRLRDKRINRTGMMISGRTPVFGKNYLRSGQHISRFDLISEKHSEEDNRLLATNIRTIIDNFDFVACADYEEANDFGVCSPEVIEAVRQNARVRFATSRLHIERFKNFHYLIGNQKEIYERTDGLQALVEVMTLGGEGAILYKPEHMGIKVESKPLTESIDPCGCGDMFYSIYASSVMAGFDTTTCLQLANAGARCVARKLFGTGQADCDEIAKEWEYLYG